MKAFIFIHVYLFTPPHNKQRKARWLHLIYEDGKKTLSDQKTLGALNGGCHLRVRRRVPEKFRSTWKPIRLGKPGVCFVSSAVGQACLKKSMASLGRRCFYSGSIWGIGMHTSRSFCGRYYRRRSCCILPSSISLGHK